MSWIRSKSPENLSPLVPHLHAISEGGMKKKKKGVLSGIRGGLVLRPLDGLGKCDSVWVLATSVGFVF